MQLPQINAAYSQRVRYGRYTARRLRRAGFTALAKEVLDASVKLRTLGRALEDADDLVQDALADRDGADDGLDSAVQDARAALAGRSARAVKEEPYTSIFPDGVDYYLDAPVNEEAERYNLLVSRVKEHLPKSDAVGKKLVKDVPAGLTAYAGGVKALAAARSAEALADGKLKSATSAWNKLLERTYGTLVAKVGKFAAEQFFPKQSKKAKAEPIAAPPA